MSPMSRRTLLKAGAASAALAGSAAPAPKADAAKADDVPDRWTLAMNASTIRPAPVEEKIKVTAEAGYDGLELWLDDLDAWEKSGKAIEDLGARIRDAGLWVPNVIGIWGSMPPTEEEKDKKMDGFKRKMRRAHKVGAQSIAAIPVPCKPGWDVPWAAARYRELFDAGREIGIRVSLEFVGFIKTVHTLGQAAAIILEADRPGARLVADTFHVYRGGSNFQAVRYLAGRLFQDWHFNDAPRTPPRFEQGDEHRVYPGDGILPLPQLLRDLWAGGFHGPLSLELFMREEWKRPPAEVAKRGMEKMKQVIAEAGVGA